MQQKQAGMGGDKTTLPEPSRQQMMETAAAPETGVHRHRLSCNPAQQGKRRLVNSMENVGGEMEAKKEKEKNQTGIAEIKKMKQCGQERIGLIAD